MTDLNSKPYTIQMIRNDTTLGKEEGSREHRCLSLARQTASAETVPSISLQCPLLRAAGVPRLRGEPSLPWEPRGRGRAARHPLHTPLTLEGKAVVHIQRCHATGWG